jgi:ADP-ribose 1''-phosphate phosphatase
MENNKDSSSTSIARHSRYQGKDANESHKELQPDGDMDISTLAKQSIFGARKLTIIEETGDLFDAPARSILVHACNCQGKWGAGIARNFKKFYPQAFRVYKDHCDRYTADQLLGTTLVIPPCEEDERSCWHYIGCLFTSEVAGKKKGSPSKILAATHASMTALLELLERSTDIEGIYMCKINAGLFNVPWEETKKVLEGLAFDFAPTNSEIRVWFLEPDQNRILPT